MHGRKLVTFSKTQSLLLPKDEPNNPMKVKKELLTGTSPTLSRLIEGG